MLQRARKRWFKAIISKAVDFGANCLPHILTSREPFDVLVISMNFNTSGVVVERLWLSITCTNTPSLVHRLQTMCGKRSSGTEICLRGTCSFRHVTSWLV